MRSVTRPLFLIAVFGAFFLTAVHSRAALSLAGDDASQVGIGASHFVQAMAERAIGFLADANLSEEDRRAHFQKLLDDSFDMQTIGRFALGRYWRASQPEQRDEYMSLFRKMIVNVYAHRFSEYSGERFEARSFRVGGPNDTIVTSYILSEGNPEVQVDWRIRYKDGQYRVVDVIVEGVSMLVTQRSDFASVIQRGGGDLEVLLAHLRQQ